MANFVRDANKLLDYQNSLSMARGALGCPFTIILSDGRFNKGNVQKYMQEATEKRYLYIFVILDAPTSSASHSILSLRSSVRSPSGGVKLVPYLKDFPFSYYCIVNDLSQLPSALGAILVQYFSMVGQ
jgi:midasin (ATPase involved in ribosome maturation)